MSCEIINLKHDSIFVNERVKLAAYVRFDNHKSVYFSSGAAREFGLKHGLYLHFVNDGDMWLFYCNSDRDGFRLLERKDKTAVTIHNSALIELFLKRTRCSLPCKFPLTLTNAKQDGCQLIKIELHKPMEATVLKKTEE